MNSFSIFITLCIGLAAANVVKRQASPPPPTLPPMKSDAPSGAPMVSDPVSMPSVPNVDTTPMVVPGSSSQVMPVMTTPDMPMVNTSMVMVDTASTMPPMDPDTTTQTAQPPAPTTTKKPTIDELVSVDEILEVFGNVATSDYFKSLPYEDQLLVMEILTGGETGKMSAILDSVELKHLLTFMYNTPFKYADPLWRVIFLGYTREEIIAQ